MNKLEFTNKVIDNLNDCIHEDGKVGLAKFIELTNKLYEAINYTHSCTELICDNCDGAGGKNFTEGFLQCPKCKGSGKN